VSYLHLIYAAVGFIAAGTALVTLANRRARKPDPLAWIDDRIAAERDSGRRTSWRMIRRALEEEEL
jgi:hypothetical protein